jgi:hypothetical protein
MAVIMTRVAGRLRQHREHGAPTLPQTFSFCDFVMNSEHCTDFNSCLIILFSIHFEGRGTVKFGRKELIPPPSLGPREWIIPLAELWSFSRGNLSQPNWIE